MDDQQIVQLIWDREERGILELSEKYKDYCYSISSRILHCMEDTLECMNDTWLHVWNAIPPNRPAHLPGWLAKIVRNLSLNRYRENHARKRHDMVAVALDELAECLPDQHRVDEHLEQQALVQSIQEFLEQQTKQNRIIFLQRYFYMMPIKEISSHLSIREGTVKSTLCRMRKSLKNWLKQEAIEL